MGGLVISPVVPGTLLGMENPEETQRLLDELVALLDLEELDLNIFRGRSPKESRVRVFGGQVAAQALVAAGRTAQDTVAHSLHAYFLRAGDPSIPILYEVDRIRDGKSFATRRVVAIQRGRAIFNLQASFQHPEPGPDHQMKMPDAPDPESLPTWAERMAKTLVNEPQEVRDWFQRPRPLELRYVESFDPERRSQGQHVWLRVKRPAAGSSAAPPVRRRLRLGHDAAGYGDAAARSALERSALHDGEPGPRDVVPPRPSGGRVAFVFAGEPVWLGRARLCVGAPLPARRNARRFGSPGGARPTDSAEGVAGPTAL